MNTYNRQLDFSLLIPCYNDLEGLILSIKSVDYYPGRFLIVVVDDGSKIPVTASLLKEKIQLNYEIVIVRNDTNLGITNALNKGLKWIEDNTHSKYIARLDCSDLCRSDRFFKQVAYMDNHNETGLLGSWCKFDDKDKLEYNYKTPVNHQEILKAMHFKNIFIHPTVLFRADLLKKAGYYPYEFPHAEDYAFFWKLLKIEHGHILDEYLVICKINDEGISLKNRKKQFFTRIRVIYKYGTNPFFKVAAMVRILALSLIPSRLALQLKNIAKT